MIIRTITGYDFFEVSSAMQKAIRRNDAAVAGYFALELWTSGYRDYVWKRLFTISAEDCHGVITKEIEALWQGHELVNKTASEPKGRIFVSKAVLLLCSAGKCRDADHLQNFIYDRKMIDVEKWIEDVRQHPIPIPEYTFDVHTRKGKKRGRTKEEFFREEFEALQPRIPGLFDDLVPERQPTFFDDV
jgi:replication-associated recombination protein RarA